jgi:hypothetical protein
MQRINDNDLSAHVMKTVARAEAKRARKRGRNLRLRNMPGAPVGQR